MTQTVRETLQKFQDGYVHRNVEELDAFMQLFAERDDIEMIGIGAAERAGFEWFEGPDKVREIIESDWTYWGDVTIDVAGAKVTTLNDIAWLSTTGTVTQTDTFDETLPFYLDQMKEKLEDDQLSPAEKMMEATHYGVRRLRERQKGAGHQWPFVLTAVLLRSEAGWQFHTLHWSMPVD
jgi:hypothetical protein